MSPQKNRPRAARRFLRPLALAGALLLAGGAPSLHARSFWLLPSATVLTPADGWVTVDVGVSTAPFEGSTHGMELDNLHVTAPDGTRVAPQNPLSGKLRSVFDVPLTQRGTYRLEVVDDSVFATWKDAEGKTGRWRGKPGELAQKVPANAQDVQAGQLLWRIETFVTAGAPGALHPSARQPGQGLEMVPVTHPNDLVAGEEAQLRFHLNGKPAPDLQVRITPGGFRWRNDAGVMQLKTDAQGLLRVRWPGAGMYLVNASAADEGSTVANVKQRRLFYAGTLEVLP